LIFFSLDWEDIGTRWSLREVLKTITGIHSGVFIGLSLETYSTAQNMSWASRRETTRIEDTAYCLMWIFGINMPMLYGEGGRAFMRLQEEILRNTKDQTIFAWRSDPAPGFEYSLLASHPSAFAASGHFEIRTDFPPRHTPISLSNGYIQVQLPVLPQVNSINDDPDLLLAVLDCTEGTPRENQICIVMRKFAGSLMVRINTTTLQMVKTADVSSLASVTIHNKITLSDLILDLPMARFSCRLDNGDLLQQEIILLDFAPRRILQIGDKILFHLDSDSNDICAMRFQDRFENTFDVKISISQRQAFQTLYTSIGQDNSSSSIPDTVMYQDPYFSCSRGWSPNSDRLLWHWKGGNMWILVAIKKCVEDGRARYVVHLSSRELD
jgi:hypothetical protein